MRRLGLQLREHMIEVLLFEGGFPAALAGESFCCEVANGCWKFARRIAAIDYRMVAAGSVALEEGAHVLSELSGGETQ